MAHLSVIIPYYREPFLDRTIASLKENAEGEIEILPIEGSRGMRAAINEGVSKATGEYIMKLDAHCIFDKGFDRILTDNCAENWLVIPRRYSIDETNWTRDDTRLVRDYHYFSFPRQSLYGFGMHVSGWERMNQRRRDPKYDIDDTMAFQGSCWMANRKYYLSHVGFLDDRKETYGTFAGDQLELGLKYWLNGGEVKINKKTWYAHLAKRKHHYLAGLFSRKYKKSAGAVSGHTWAAKHWMNNEEPNMLHPFSWLIEKFRPIPSWPDNWQEEYEKNNLRTN